MDGVDGVDGDKEKTRRGGRVTELTELTESTGLLTAADSDKAEQAGAEEAQGGDGVGRGVGDVG